MAATRQFFATRGIYEVDVPLLSTSTVSDPYIQSFCTDYQVAGKVPQTRYLQTSPEYFMKRLLAADSGAIYYLGKAFRDGECGAKHNPEFTLLEWYRPGFDHHDLMAEVDAFLQALLHCPPATTLSYQAAFEQYCHLDPHRTSKAELRACLQQFNITVSELATTDAYLDVLMTHVIEPNLGQTAPCFIYHYPKSQAALATLTKQDGVTVAERFEVYYQGYELANGFRELTDSDEQAERFRDDLALRQQLQLAMPPMPETLLQALAHGLPDCAGVALGFDRLAMLACAKDTISDVISFDFARS